MGKEKFEEYLKSQQNTQDKTIDWELKKEEWIKEIDTFLEQIKSYFEKYRDSVVIQEQSLTINEEYLGAYTTKKLIIKFNNDTVTFIPVGKNIIGAKGRVDMEGKAGKVKFVLVGEKSQTPQSITTFITNDQEKNTWKISTPPPKIKYIELDENSFFDALMEVING